jgi:hypothetical protein
MFPDCNPASSLHLELLATQAIKRTLYVKEPVTYTLLVSLYIFPYTLTEYFYNHVYYTSNIVRV